MQNLIYIFSTYNPTGGPAWHYRRASTSLIRTAIDHFDWDNSSLSNSVDKKVSKFSQNILKIISNFISHETIAYNDRDPVWITKEIKNLIDQKHRPYIHFDHHD